MFRQIKLLVLDLDYVVLDCAALKVRALRDSLMPFAEYLPHDVRLPDSLDIEQLFLEQGSHWIRSLDIGLPDDQLLSLESSFRPHEVRLLEADTGRTFPGVANLLMGCRNEGLKLALGAEGSRDYLMAFCDRNEMDLTFDIAVCTEEFGVGGTEEMISEIMDHSEVTASETILLATLPRYFEAGRDLGTLTIGCGWGIHEHAALSHADFQSLTLQHALPIIRQADSVTMGESH